MYDHDQSGCLNTFELRRALTSAGYHLNSHILNALVLRYGDKEGKMTFDDFVSSAVKLKTMIGWSMSIEICFRLWFWPS
jgi:calpain